MVTKQVNLERAMKNKVSSDITQTTSAELITRRGNRVIPTMIKRFFAKLRKANISFVMSVCPSVRNEQLGSPWKYFHKILY